MFLESGPIIPGLLYHYHNFVKVVSVQHWSLCYPQLGLEKVSFMGQTMGGRVGMILALTRPNLFDRLICVDSTPR